MCPNQYPLTFTLTIPTIHTIPSDGDSKAFDAICQKKPYGDEVSIDKLEWVNHVKKWMGTSLRTTLTVNLTCTAYRGVSYLKE